MSLDLGTLVLHLAVDDGQLEQGLARGESRIGRFGSFVGNALKAVSAVTVGGLAAAGTVGIKTAAQLEQAEISFTTMLGSGEAAKAFLGDLSAFAAKTPFELPGLQKSASSLVSAGIDASKVIPIMTSLGNATSGMGTGAEGVQRATIALQQMNAAGRITGEDLNQLRDAGIPVYDLLASATGKSKEEVSELARAGKLGKEELGQMMAALESGAGLERFSGLMDKQSQSLTGLWSTLKDTFSVGMAQAIAPALPLIKQGLGGAITFVADGVPKLTAGVANLMAGLSGSGPVDGFSGKLNTLGLGVRALVLAYQDGDVSSDGFVGAMERIGVQLSKAGPALDQMKTTVRGLFPSDAGGGIDFAAALDRVQELGVLAWQAIQDIGGGLTGLRPVAEVTGAVFGFFADHIDTIVQLMPLIVAAFIAYKAAMVVSTISAIAQLPITALLAASNFAHASAIWALLAAMGIERTSRLASIAAWIAQTVQVVIATVQVYAHMAGLLLLAGAQKAITAATWLFNAALSANPIGLVVAAIALLVAGFILAYRESETFRSIVDASFQAIKVVTGNVVGTMITYFSMMLGVWLTVVGGILDGATAAFGWVPGVGDKLKGANQAFDAMRVGIERTLDDAAQAAYGFGEKAGGNYAGGITGTTQGVSAAGANLGSASVTAMDRAAGAAKQSGANVGAGFVSGINGALGAARAAAESLAAVVGPTMRRRLQEASPSRVTHRIGEHVGDGLVGGMMARLGAVARVADEMAGAAVPLPVPRPFGQPVAGTPAQARAAAASGMGTPSAQVQVTFADGMGWLAEFVQVQVDGRDRELATTLAYGSTG